MERTEHKFSHLGQYPYKFVGYEKLAEKRVQVDVFVDQIIPAGGSCDHCGAYIIDAYIFESADGKQFKVGSTCVSKSGDAGLVKQIKNTVNKIKRERKAQADALRIENAKTVLLPQLREQLEARPHPSIDGKSLADYCDWMFAHAGNSGCMRIVRNLEKLAKAGE